MPCWHFYKTITIGAKNLEIEKRPLCTAKYARGSVLMFTTLPKGFLYLTYCILSWKYGSAIMNIGHCYRGPGSIPSIHTVALWFLFPGIWHDFLTSGASALTWCYRHPLLFMCMKARKVWCINRNTDSWSHLWSYRQSISPVHTEYEDTVFPWHSQQKIVKSLVFRDLWFENLDAFHV